MASGSEFESKYASGITPGLANQKLSFGRYIQLGRYPFKRKSAEVGQDEGNVLPTLETERTRSQGE